jgi:hypothetical protein
MTDEDYEAQFCFPPRQKAGMKWPKSSWFKSDPVEPEKLWWEDEWKRVLELYPIGKQYKLDFNGLAQPRYPHMTCEYADDKGQLHEWCFTLQMRVLLLNMAKAPKPDRLL